MNLWSVLSHSVVIMDINKILIDGYEINKAVQWIEDNKYVKVGLQFPDEWLNVADRIVVTIQKKLTAACVYILADSSYGSCCVDEISAAHVSADAIIHFGPACLSPSERLPVYYVFEQSPLNCKQAALQLKNIIPNPSTKLILIVDVKYAWISNSLADTLLLHFPNLLLSKLMIPGISTNDKTNTDLVINGRKIRLTEGQTIDDYSVVYIGEDGRTLTSFLMILNKCRFYRYDPAQDLAVEENFRVNRSLRKRVFAIEQARSSTIVGILVGTLGVSGYLSIIERLKKVGKQAGKKTYTIVVGRLNPTKLANFPEIDVFVLVACWENTLLEAKDFYKPIITPFEFEIACNSNRQWKGEYITDFQQVLPGGLNYVDLPEVSNEPLQSWDRSIIAKEGTVSEIHQQAGGEFLINRSWKGLEPKLEQSEPANIAPGEYGIASRYSRETSH